MRLRSLTPLVLAVLALSACAGGGGAPPNPAPTTTPGSNTGADGGAAWSTDLLATTCVEEAATASPENAANFLDHEVHWDRARSGERPDGLWVVEVPYSETGGEFAGSEGSYYCFVGGTAEAPEYAAWGQAVPFTDAEFASYVDGEWLGGVAPGK